MPNYLNEIKEAIAYIESATEFRPKIGMVLGSGLGVLADEIEESVVIPYEDIRHFPVSTVEGHAGQLVIGKLNGKVVMAMKGRIHYYEGYSMKQITFPIRVMQLMGVKTLIVTNACGGVNKELPLGGLMFIKDHVNFMGDNPLMGHNHEELGPRFPDMLNAYDKDLIKLGQEVGKKIGIETHSGVHSAVSGPIFETGAELKMFNILGIDTIGMSTIPEVIVANHGGMKSLGISCITDIADPESGEPVTHEAVLAVIDEIRPRFIRLVKGIVEAI